MPSIRPYRAGFRAEIALKGHPRVSRCFPTEEEAAAWAAETERELRAGAKVDPRRRRLSDAITAYLRSPAADRLTAHERSVLAWWRRQLGARRLSTLKRADFVEARDQLRGVDGSALAPATINRRMALISGALTFALERDWIPVNVARIRRLPENNTRERLLTPDERARLLDACQRALEPDLFPLVVCAMVSGARLGELLGLTWSQVDLERGVGRLIRTKNGRRRPIPLRGPALEQLRALAERRGEIRPDALVFRHRDGRAPFRHRRAWTAARRAAGLLDLRFHDLRHGFASALAEDGASSRELQHATGHVNANMLARYAHFQDERTLELGDRLVARLFPEWRPDA